MKILKSIFFLGPLFILVCVVGNKSSVWGEKNKIGVEIASDQEYSETVCLFATVPLEKVITSEIEKNGEIYLTSSPEVGLYFIERNISMLEQLQAKEFGLVSQKGWMWDLSINYGIYGKLLRKVGKTEEAEPFLDKALKVSQEAGGKFTSQVEFLAFLERLEESNFKNNKSNAGKVDLPFSLSPMCLTERR